jgi:nanoRNase/pAp phosphatase (c-di-AMP/oligoRNAs hydrolase)
MGTYADEVVMSVRTNDMEGHAGQVVQAVIEGLGTGGGHTLMAGGRVPLDGQSPRDVERELRRRFLRQLDREGLEGAKLI